MTTAYEEGEAVRVRDVIVCAASRVDLDDGEFRAHPPVGMTPRILFENAVPAVDLGEGITLTSLDEGANIVMRLHSDGPQL